MAEDDRILWDSKYDQLWQQMFSPDGKKLAAIVAPEYGKWTIAVDDIPWDVCFEDMVTDPVFSPDSSRLAAVVKEGKAWSIVVDGQKWQHEYDMAWQPVFSPDSQTVIAKVEKQGKYTLVANDRPLSKEFDAAWQPIFSPQGDKLLMRTIEDGTYCRKIVPVPELTG